MKSGIYCIKNIVNNKMYIGQSQDIMDRWSKHLTALKCGKHENKYLQSAYDMNWNFIQRFTCLRDFAEQNNLSEKSLRGCICGKLLSNFGKRYKKITKEIILP